MNAKQRKLKKLAIILLAVIAILAISIPVFAATNGDAATTTATAETAVELQPPPQTAQLALRHLLPLLQSVLQPPAVQSVWAFLQVRLLRASHVSRRLKARSVPPSCSASSLSRRLSFMPCSLLSSSSSSCKGECRS